MSDKIKIVIFIAIFVGWLSAYAQTPDAIRSEINSIKMNEKFIYGEGYDPDEPTARKKAIADLVTFSNEIRTERGLEELTDTDIQRLMKEMKYKKGQQCVVFVYAPFENILLQQPGTSSETSAEEKPPVYGAIYNPTPAGESKISQGLLEILCNQDNWIEIKGFLTTYKQKGEITETGRCFSAREVPDDAYSILIDEMYGILSILSPKNSERRVNCKTNQPDSETNYSNCKVIVWYR